jgi:hydrogenase large subunit
VVSTTFASTLEIPRTLTEIAKMRNVVANRKSRAMAHRCRRKARKCRRCCRFCRQFLTKSQTASAGAASCAFAIAHSLAGIFHSFGDWPKEVKGLGFTEVPRGALAHWIRIKDAKIENYPCVPTTWNGSPRDSEGNIGAFEASLMDTKMECPEEPVEILHTLHSFDTCLACSTHVMGLDGQESAKSKVR